MASQCRYNAAMKNYADIFQLRGQQHAEAFRRYPEAIREEAEAIISLAALKPNDVVLDLPAASGFLAKYMNLPQVRLMAVEPSQPLYDLCKVAVDQSYMAPLNRLPIESEHVDVAICLAGLHHEQALNEIFDEVFRVLRNGGRFAIAEVNSDSGPAAFLNNFVNRHSTLGHSGSFASGDYIELLESAGFQVAVDTLAAYHWRFASDADMAECLRLMFGIDRATPEQIISAVSELLGIDQLAGGLIGMRWSLRHFLCYKPVSTE